MKFYTFCEFSLEQIYEVKGFSESYQHQFSSNNVSTQSREQVMRIYKMLTK